MQRSLDVPASVVPCMYGMDILLSARNNGNNAQRKHTQADPVMAQDDVLVRYLSDSLKMVEQAMKSGPPRSSSQRVPATTASPHHASTSRPEPTRRATSDVMAAPDKYRYSSTQHARQTRDTDVQNKLRHSMQALPSNKPGTAGPRWSSTGRGASAQEEGRATTRPALANQGGFAAPKQAPGGRGVEAVRAGHRVSADPAHGDSRPQQHDRAAPRTPQGGKPPVPPLQQQPGAKTTAARQAPRGPGSDAGSNADWWRPSSGSSSVGSYPMTAITDRAGGSVASTEFKAWMERINQLESAVQDERSKRRQFEQEMKKMYSDSVFGVSRGDVATGAGAGGPSPPQPAGGKGGKFK